MTQPPDDDLGWLRNYLDDLEAFRETEMGLSAEDEARQDRADALLERLGRATDAKLDEALDELLGCVVGYNAIGRQEAIDKACAALAHARGEQ